MPVFLQQNLAVLKASLHVYFEVLRLFHNTPLNLLKICFGWFCFSFSLFHDPDEGHKEYLVDIFENQTRGFPGGDFKAAEHNWTDAVRTFLSLC